MEGFKHLLTKSYDDVDQAIYAIRQALQKGRDERIDFYGEEFHGQWWIDPSPTNDRSFWWVNQGKTYVEERDGGYVWAPQRTKTGANPYYFWENVSPVYPATSSFTMRAAPSVLSGSPPGTDARLSVPRAAGCRMGHRGVASRLRVRRASGTNPPATVQPRLVAMDIDKGPLNDAGRVNQGYLYGIPAQAAFVLAEHLSRSELPDGNGRGSRARRAQEQTCTALKISTSSTTGRRDRQDVHNSAASRRDRGWVCPLSVTP